MTLKKNLNELLKRLKSKGYSAKTIDFEPCLYKNFGDFDIEGSGLNNQRTKCTANIIYIWNRTENTFGYPKTFCEIFCKDFAETEEACLMIEKAVADYQRTGTADYPFNLLFDKSGINKGECSKIVKNKDSWTEGYIVQNRNHSVGEIYLKDDSERSKK